MDPLTASMAFASIVGLISIFKQERTAKTDQNTESFLRWLDEHRHQEMKEFILRSDGLSNAINQALHEDHEVILGKLRTIDEMLAALVSQVTGMSSLAHVIHPNVELSDQAISILRQLSESKAAQFLKVVHAGGTALNSDGREMQVDDFRFLDDDLDTLVNLGLLLLRVGRQGYEVYRITRRAVKLIEAIDRSR